MKKLTAIWILAIMLFNGMGYQVLTSYLQHRADERAQALIDTDDYDKSSLIELSADLSLPYTTNWTDWEQVEGDIVIDGIHYRYVERKLSDGRMYVRCLPNQEKQNVLTARDEFVKLAYSFNKPTDQKKSMPVFVSNYIGDYDDACDQWQLQLPGKVEYLKIDRHLFFITSPFIDAVCLPPEILA